MQNPNYHGKENEKDNNIHNRSLSALNWITGAGTGDPADVEDGGGEMTGGGGEPHSEQTSHTR